MRDTIEMAREAGFPFNKYGLLQGDGDGEIDADKMFKAFEALVRADERERMYGKDIDTLLFEEHRLGFEKGSRSERETCAKLCDEARAARLAEQIRARGETK
jgi:MoaA/NifB/PqqE/SkfB family radical SAM enzyme